jgi:hypothetical protein
MIVSRKGDLWGLAKGGLAPPNWQAPKKADKSEAKGVPWGGRRRKRLL